jgi:hypothetical protein
VSGDIRVRPEHRGAFLAELQETLQGLFTRYGGAEGDAFRLAVAVYPKTDAAADRSPGDARQPVGGIDGTSNELDRSSNELDRSSSEGANDD